MSTEGTGDRIKVREGAAVWRRIEGETVLLDIESSLYLGINDAGSILWPAMVRGAARQELVDLLVSTYGVDADQAGTDVDSFVEACRSRHLLEA
jgi:hypothetical protein